MTIATSTSANTSTSYSYITKSNATPDPFLKVAAAPVWKENEEDTAPDPEPMSPISPASRVSRQSSLRKKSLALAELRARRRSKAEMWGYMSKEEIEEKVKKVNEEKPKPYNVFNFYKKDGLAQEIAKHPLFENVTLSVIALNAVYIAVDTDWNKDDYLQPVETNSLSESPWFFQVCEHLFCLYFTVEILFRFAAFELKRNCMRDGWFVFDSILVTLMVAETWVVTVVFFFADGGEFSFGNISILRLLRLFRLTRLVRMLRSLPELMILVKGMVSAMQSVFYVMCLLLLTCYVFAIVFTIMSVGNEELEVYFGNVLLSIYTLLIYATYLDNLAFFLDLIRINATVNWQDYFLLPLAAVFIFVAALTLMNMLIGVLCDVVQGVAQEEKAEMLQEKVNQKMFGVAERLDTSKNKLISYEEFAEIVHDHEALQCMQDVGVNPYAIAGMAELFFIDPCGESIELTFDRFMEMVLDLREENEAKVKNMKWLWMQIKMHVNDPITEMKKDLAKLEQEYKTKLQNLEKELEGIISELRKLVPKEPAAAA